MSENNDIEKMIISFNGKECEIFPKISTSDIFMIEEANDVEKSENTTLIAKSIANKTKGIFTYEEIVDQVDIIDKYIDAVVKSDERLRKNFEVIDNEKKENRFVQAWSMTRDDYARELKSSLANLNLPSFSIPDYSNLVQPAIDVQNKIANITAPIIQMSNQINSIISSAMTGINESISKIVDSYRFAIPDYSNMISDLLSSVRTMLENITIPTMKEEEKQALIDSYTEWGKYGWTMPPEADFDLFDLPPENIKDAYSKVRLFTRDDNMKYIFGQLKDMQHIRQSDLCEAISCFESKYYKACAMIIFSMIDARLIRSQKDAQNKGQRRKSGKNAAEILFNRMDEESPEDILLYELLWRQNLISAINVTFANGNDFIAQPDIINRNFLDHGMLHRKVTRKDCIMLFLLLYNFSLILNNANIR